MTFSIITCTYNPNSTIFKRLIKAVADLDLPKDIEVEWIVVDNNSKQSVVKSFDFSSIQIPLHHVVARTPGLTSARIAGFKASKGEWLVFFDDDNEPFSNYLIELLKGIEEYPQVNCWGPGYIEVEYIGKVKKWFHHHKNYYQERKEPTQYGQEKLMQAYYPIGTGLCIRNEAIMDYVMKVDAGQYNVSDRTGRSLVSGGDTQIVLNNQFNGGVAGKLEQLALTHLIEARKATYQYLKQQKFWTGASYHMVLQQVYPEMQYSKEHVLNFKLIDVIVLLKKFYYELKVKKKDIRSAYLNTCGYLGEYYAPYFAIQQRPNQLFTLVQKLMIS